MLWRASVRHLLRHPWQMGSALLGIVLGVAVVVAVDLANSSASRGFALSQQALAGEATHRILGGPRGVPERLYVALRTELGLHRSAPAVEGSVRLADGSRLRLLGLDPFAEAALRPRLLAVDGGDRPLPLALDQVLLPRAEAARRGLAVGDKLTIPAGDTLHTLTVAGVIDEKGALGELLVVDIALAQTLLGRQGRLDRIDLAMAEAELSAVQARLPGDAQLVRTADQTLALGRMSDAFQLNLTAFSLLALMVGAFLIYNSMSFSVVQRRELIGILRAVGVTPVQIASLVLGEALLLALLGTAAGVGLGVVLAQLLLELVTRTINDLYYALVVKEVALVPLTLTKGVALGIGATLLAALAPARAAATVAPRLAMTRSDLEGRRKRWLRPLAVAGAALCMVGGALLVLTELLWLAFAGLFLLLMGAALLTPAAALALVNGLGRTGGGLLWPMAVRSVSAHLSRSAVAIAALMIAVSAVIGVGVMVDSFRQTFAGWLDVTLRADFALTAPGAAADELTNELAMLPGVAAVTGARFADIALAGANDSNGADGSDGIDGSQRLRLRAVEPGPAGADSWQVESGDLAGAWPAFVAGRALLITEPLAVHRQLVVGDSLTLATAAGARELPIAAIVHDYTSSAGAAILVRDAYRRLWRDDAVDQLAVYAAPDADRVQLVVDLRAALAGRPEVRLHASSAVRAQALRIFDQTFTVTRVLELLATLVAAVGVLSALLALALERSREFAMLRALGLTPAELMRLMVAQTGVLGLLAGLLALPVGLVLAAALTGVINRRAFGWTLELTIDPWLVAQGLLLALGAALLAGLLPAWRLRRLSPALALQER